MDDQISEALTELKDTLARLQELVEWERLAQQELRREVPPAFRPQDHTWQEIRELYGRFLRLDSTLHQALSEPHAEVPTEQLEHSRAELRQFEEQLRDLRLSERFLYF